MYAPPVPETARPAVLIADDESILRRLMRRVLESGGHIVREAADGDEALDALRTGHGNIDVVVLDLGMPPHGSLTTLERVLALRPDVGIVLTSGLPPDPDVGALLLRHRGLFLQKPFAPDALQRAVSSLAPKRAE